jgi:peroxiredoxin
MKTLIASVLFSFSALAMAASVGQPAPAFSVTDTNGKTVNLSDFKGKTVVLEWTNPECPFVQKHYGGANMQGTQKDANGKGVVWLTVNSTGREHQDFKPPAEMAKWMQSQKANATATLMDADGKVGKAYAARTTPHMYVVDGAGTLVYAGGIDNKPSANPADIPGATNYVKTALTEIAAGKPVSNANTKPYGCSIKYSSGA